MNADRPAASSDAKSMTHPESRGRTEADAIPAENINDDGRLSDNDTNLYDSAELDERITAAAKALFFAPDLVRPGPGLLPIGAKARARRERRHEVDDTAAARRAELQKLLITRHDSRTINAFPSRRRGRPALVAALLTAVVIAIAIAGWCMSLAEGPAGSREINSDIATLDADPPRFERESIIQSASAWTRNSPVPKAPTMFTSPEAAAAAWLAIWCPIDPQENPDDLTAAVRAVMTPAGWEQFTGTPGQLMTDPAPDMSASCDAPKARIVTRTPGDESSVVVAISATRTIANADNVNAAESFLIERRQYVVRGEDGAWRVDIVAVGG